ncbi:hypothetical protein BBJ28_00016288 [Nothophytophthora sp. Chile5]|nr:hypothetical protein BBJ28_00016288 [Nothophytophthora sp. Chile5]
MATLTTARVAVALVSLTPFGLLLAVRCKQWPVPLESFLQSWGLPSLDKPKEGPDSTSSLAPCCEHAEDTSQTAIRELRRNFEQMHSLNNGLVDNLKRMHDLNQRLVDNLKELQTQITALSIEKELRNVNRQLALKRVVKRHRCPLPARRSDKTKKPSTTASTK